MAEDNIPLKRIRFGMVHASVWQNEANGKTFYSVTLERAYKEGDETKYSNSFGRSDLLDAAKALDQAHTWINDQFNEAH